MQSGYEMFLSEPSCSIESFPDSTNGTQDWNWIYQWICITNYKHYDIYHYSECERILKVWYGYPSETLF